MQLKKIVAIFLAAILMLCSLVITASAENTEIFKVEVEAETTTSTLSSSPIIYNYGDEITVKISASQNTGITSLMLYIDYDENVLEVVPDKYKTLNLFTGSDELTSGVTSNGDGYFTFYSDNYPQVSTATGVMAEITFIAKENCIADTAVTVTTYQNSDGFCTKQTITGLSPVPFDAEWDTFAIHDIDKTTGIIEAPTCTEDGYSTYMCDGCQATVVGNIVPALGHDLKHTIAKEPTCTDIGWNAYDTCQRTGCDYTTYKEIAAHGHTPAQAVVENRVEPDCTNAGSYDSVVYCSVCDAELSREKKSINALGHDLKHTVAKEPTCTDIGWNAYDTCQRAGCDYTTYKEIPATGEHTYEWVIDKQGNCGVNGVKHEECSVCRIKRSENTVIEATGNHTYDNTCDTTCNVCEYEREITHTYINDVDPICNVCGNERETTHTGWWEENGKWLYYNNGVKLTNCWKEDSIGWCYLGADGYCVTNCWVADSVGWCYLDENGRMVTNRWVMDSVGWCYVGADGYCVTNCWVADSVGWCYLEENGRMETNKWVMDSVGWCYLGADGYCVTNCWVADSVGWCYLNANGNMTKSDWVYDGGCWYYLDANGYMVTGTHTINGTVYNFDSSGVWIA